MLYCIIHKLFRPMNKMLQKL